MRKFFPVRRPGFAVATVICVLVGTTPAVAQGLLESLFGVFAPKPPPTVHVPSRPERSPSPGAAGRTNPFDGPRRRSSYSSGGRYKTMCVRLCDGFYFPISSAARRREFYRDAEQCQSQCDSETRLFYMPRDAGSIKTARDQSGLYYESLRNAFRYRKELNESCTCRPKPWSTAERKRHARYALAEAGSPIPADGVGEKDADGRDGDPPAAVASTSNKTKGEGAGDIVQAVRQPPPQKVVQRRTYVPLARKPKKTLPPPSYGLGGLFGGGNGYSAPAKPFKNKFRWPGDDGS